ncbi:MAG: acetyl-CoA C-acyltransferase [Armatimonadetes bacterium]|nr:acetyl-CoA C-acyltransferase [Armatimonadota bacterium]
MDVVIVRARRTPFGRFLGGLAELSAADLAVAAGTAALEGLDPARVDLLVLGNVLGAGQGMNVARQVALRLGLPESAPAFTVNLMCGSGLHSVALAAQAVRLGEAEVVLCGGTESMSNAPYLLERARSGYRLGDGKLVDAVLRDGLVDGYIGEHMAVTSERLAEQFGITRTEQDAYAVLSQQRYAAAHAAGAFAAELVPAGKLSADEHPRPETSPERLASLTPSFRADGTVTAGNASGINDGAAMLLVCSAAVAEHEGWPPLARIEAAVAVGCDPRRMGLGPVHAARKLCSRLGCDVAAFDTFEINEAFAAQTLSCLREMQLPPERVNEDGGAIALGHPIGASGARLVAHLAQRIASGRTKRGLATLCVGGGMGVGMALSA